MTSIRKQFHYLASIALIVAVLLPLPAFANDNDPVRPKIGLVLSGGGARGAAHVGVLKVLDELRIPIDCIAGTSMGAIVGGLYASGMNATELEQVFANADWPRLLSDKPPRSRRTFRRKADDTGFLVDYEMGLRKRKLLFPKGLIQGQTLSLELRKLLKNVITVNDFDQLPIPFRAVAANIETGDEIVMNAGDLAKSIRASMSVPGVFEPVNIDGNLLVDGGIVNNLPIDVIKRMGADIIIVVDVGTPPADIEELNSPLKITNQMLTILINKNSEKQKALMSANDFLITPELGQLGSSAFEKASQAISIGEQAARNSIANLARLSLGNDEYLAHRSSVQGARNEVPIISRVIIDNQSRLSPTIIQHRLADYVDKPLDVAQIEDDITNIYGFDTFDSVDYSVVTKNSNKVEQGSINELKVTAHSKDWGPNYVRFGVNLEDDFRGNSNYNLAARITRTEINRLGGEIRADIVVGDRPEFLLELYQPLDKASRWFVNPQLRYISASSGLFEDGNQLALLRSDSTNIALAFGRNISNTSELRFTLNRGFIDPEVQVGDPALATSASNVTSFDLSYLYDTIDRSAIPRYGSLFALSWAGTREDFGADESVDVASALVLNPHTWGRNTLLHWWNVGGVIEQSDTPLDSFSLGGLFNLSGYAPGELVGEYSAIGRMLYYRKLNREENSLLAIPIYLGASVEAGNVWQDSSDISFSNSLLAGSVFVVADTVLGPFYVAYGRAEGGRESAYMFLGQTF